MLIRTIYANGWSVCYGNGIGQMTLENAELYFFLHFWPWYNDRFIDSHTIYNYAPKAFLSATGL